MPQATDRVQAVDAQFVHLAKSKQQWSVCQDHARGELEEVFTDWEANVDGADDLRSTVH